MTDHTALLARLRRCGQTLETEAADLIEEQERRFVSLTADYLNCVARLQEVIKDNQRLLDKLDRAYGVADMYMAELVQCEAYAKSLEAK